ncbi:Putative ribonuclease H protein At1g65750, partial [Linum grandiflorum]
QGECVAYFVANLGQCTITRAEIRGVIFWLNLAWDLGFRHVHLQLDSTAAISVITGKDSSDLRRRSCIEEARELFSRDWSLHVIHAFREDNRAADRLAHHGHSLDFGFYLIHILPREMINCICTDSVKVYFLRMIPLIH